MYMCKGEIVQAGGEWSWLSTEMLMHRAALDLKMQHAKEQEQAL